MKKRKLLSLFLLVFLISVIPLTVYLVKQRSEMRKRAIEAPYQIPVLILSYIPLRDDGGINADITGPIGTENLEVLRSRINTFTTQIVSPLKEGSRYHGYKNSAATPSLDYSIVETKEFLIPIPRSNNRVPWGTAYRPDYDQILSNLNICNYVENRGIKQVWMWGYHHGDIEPSESNMAMGRTSQAFWNKGSYGDISNGEQINDMPICNKTYVLFNFNYGSSYVNALHNHLHQIENELAFADREMFWDIFVGRQYQFSGPRRCGHSHTPPNSLQDYSYADQNYEPSDCEDWIPVNCIHLDKNAPCGGTRTNFNCSKWDCDELKYYLWWMQNIPGKDNPLMYNGQRLRNWWDFVGDFDGALQTGKTLILPKYTPTPRLTATRHRG